MADNTFTGPRGPQDSVPDSDPIKPPTSGGTFLAIGMGLLAIILASIGIWSAANADNHSLQVDGRVTSLAGEVSTNQKAQGKWNKWAEGELAREVTEVTLLNDAVAKLQTKAEQSVLDKLAEEMKGADKATNRRVTILASDLLTKADDKTVRRLSRRIGKFNTRLVAVENIVLPPKPLVPFVKEPVPAPAAVPVPVKIPVAAPPAAPSSKPSAPTPVAAPVLQQPSGGAVKPLVSPAPPAK